MSEDADGARAPPPLAMLGVAGAYMERGDEDEYPLVSKAGGRPAWLNERGDVPACGVCGAPMRLVVQLYAPVRDTERVVYVFGCNTARCSGDAAAWAVLRASGDAAGVAGAAASDGGDGKIVIAGLEEEEEEEEDGDEEDYGEDDEEYDGFEDIPAEYEEAEPVFEREPLPAASAAAGKAAALHSVPDDWGTTAKQAAGAGGNGNGADEEEEEDLDALLEAMLDDRQGAAAAAPAAEEAPAPSKARRRRQRKRRGGGRIETHGDFFAPFYLVPVEEPAAAAGGAGPGREAMLLAEYERREGKPAAAAASKRSQGAGGDEDWSGEQYEEGDDGDAYDEFAARLERCPTQCVRSAFGSRPLWVESAQPPPPCERCGGPRAFEFQLMPSLLSDLGVGLSGMDFGTVAVWVCEAVCHTGELVREHVRVASAPRVMSRGS